MLVANKQANIYPACLAIAPSVVALKKKQFIVDRIAALIFFFEILLANNWSADDFSQSKMASVGIHE